MNDNRKLVLCVDFDGVLHSYTSGWKGADNIPDPPVDGAIEFLREAVKHFAVSIHSSRSHQPGGIEAMQGWLLLHADAELLAQIDFPNHKPAAFVTLDDRAITFNGQWPTMTQLRAFVPWNKRRPEHAGIGP